MKCRIGPNLDQLIPDSTRKSQPHQQQHRRRGRGDGDLVPLIPALISREVKSEKMERPKVRFGCAAQSKKGEDYFLMKEDCQRVPGSTSSTFSVFAIFDGHNGNAAAIPPLARPCAYGCRAGMHESESGGRIAERDSHALSRLKELEKKNVELEDENKRLLSKENNSLPSLRKALKDASIDKDAAVIAREDLSAQVLLSAVQIIQGHPFWLVHKRLRKSGFALEEEWFCPFQHIVQ